MPDTMQAYVISEPGGPERLELKDILRPSPRDGWVLIRNRAFGLNRSEWFTRRGESPSVQFPRVLGIECAGEVHTAGNYSVFLAVKMFPGIEQSPAMQPIYLGILVAAAILVGFALPRLRIGNAKSSFR